MLSGFCRLPIRTRTQHRGTRTRLLAISREESSATMVDWTREGDSRVREKIEYRLGLSTSTSRGGSRRLCSRWLLSAVAAAVDSAMLSGFCRLPIRTRTRLLAISPEESTATRVDFTSDGVARVREKIEYEYRLRLSTSTRRGGSRRLCSGWLLSAVGAAVESSLLSGFCRLPIRTRTRTQHRGTRTRLPAISPEESSATMVDWTSDGVARVREKIEYEYRLRLSTSTKWLRMLRGDFCGT